MIFREWLNLHGKIRFVTNQYTCSNYIQYLYTLYNISIDEQDTLANLILCLKALHVIDKKYSNTNIMLNKALMLKPRTSRALSRYDLSTYENSRFRLGYCLPLLCSPNLPLTVPWHLRALHHSQVKHCGILWYQTLHLETYKIESIDKKTACTMM